MVEHRPDGPPPISEIEFEEIMGRNRTVSSSAIARAVSDAAAGTMPPGLFVGILVWRHELRDFSTVSQR
jgi:hypothetical protein